MRKKRKRLSMNPQGAANIQESQKSSADETSAAPCYGSTRQLTEPRGQKPVRPEKLSLGNGPLW
jgi:hypothetical protein